jgi:hypothetical protein
MEKRKSTPQIYGKSTGNQPGWVNIQVPKEIAEALKKIDFSFEPVIRETSMILCPDVLSEIRNLLTDPASANTTHKETMLNFLDMDTFYEMGYYTKSTHRFFNETHRLFSAALVFQQEQSRKESRG